MALITDQVPGPAKRPPALAALIPDREYYPHRRLAHRLLAARSPHLAIGPWPLARRIWRIGPWPFARRMYQRQLQSPFPRVVLPLRAPGAAIASGPPAPNTTASGHDPPQRITKGAQNHRNPHHSGIRPGRHRNTRIDVWPSPPRPQGSKCMKPCEGKHAEP